jgi:alpha-L-rhamnosidase
MYSNYVIYLLNFISLSCAFPSSISDIPLISIPTLFNYTNDVITDNNTFPIILTYSSLSTSYVILDYGENVGGFPFFDIDQVTGNSSLRVSYSEALPNVVDGDIEFYPLIRSFDPSRVKIYAIMNPGHIESPLIQGAQRYQRLALISGGSIRISNLGIKSTHYTKKISLASGSFSCSSVLYTNMWKMGVRTLQINMIPPRIIPPGFIATDQGFFLTPNQAGVYLRGMQWVNYTVTFSTMIVRGGTSFALRSNDYSEILITINSNEHSSPNTLVVNTRQELPPPDTYIYNATLPRNISLLQWYDIKAIIQGLTIELSINGIDTFTIPIPESSSPYIPSITPGGIAFTTSNNQETFFRDLQVTDLSSTNFGAILYQDSLISKQAVSDFGVGTNELALILDGAKRDRNVWSGDLLVAGPVLYYSFYEPEYAAGSLAILNSYQLTNGPVSSRINVGFPFQRSSPSDEFVSPIFYSYTYFLANLISVAEYYLYTSDVQFVQDQWPRMQLLMNFFSTLVDTNNLVVASYPVWGYDYNPSYGTYTGRFTKLNILYAMALENAASLADVVNNATAALQYRQQAAAVRTAVNTYLYNSTAKFYMISDQQTVGITQDTNSLAILSGIASELDPNLPQQLLQLMKQKLRVLATNGTGYLSITSDGIPAGTSVIVSPFISFFHAAAAFEQNISDLAFDVLDSVWSPMAQQGPYFTGTFWELELPSGYPDASTSMAHTWSAGITPILSKYVLGIKPIAAGYTEWSIRPQPGNLTWAAGSVCTPHGIMTVNWNNSNAEFRIMVNIPRSTSGVVFVPTQNNCITVNGKSFDVGSYDNSVYGVDKIARNGSYLAVYIVSSGPYSIIANFICNAVSALFIRSSTLICLISCSFIMSLELSL